MSAIENIPTIAFANAEIAGFGRGVLRIDGERIVSVGARAKRGDHIVDLRGERLLPGLVNAHDHLHRNHYPRLKYRECYENASEWAADIDCRRKGDAVLTACAAVPRADRLAIGVLKNLLSGATTVAHHDAPCAELASPELPVLALPRYGWAHSLAIDGAERVRQSHGATPADVPWFIHAGEGTDAAAADEAAQLDALQVLTPNTVLIHGTAFDAAARARLLERRVGLVWCPGSNHFLYGRSAAVRELAPAGLLALGSDSRLSGERDLLDELRIAQRTGEIDDTLLESLVTTGAARLLMQPDRGTLRAGAVADLIVLPRDARLWEVRRADLRCVISRGRMRCGDNDYADYLLEPEMRVPATIDGRRKCVAASVAELLARVSIREPGFELVAAAVRAA
jgi:cytosine/adenosine deaminase-related metal-dependent hydrolase